MYAWNGTKWNTKGNYTRGPDKSFFGYSVSLSSNGDIRAIGAVLAVYAEVYEWNGLQWKLRGKRLCRHSWFGHTVRISSDGNILAIGAPLELNKKGRVYVYDWNGSEYEIRSTFAGLKDGDEGGWSMDLSEDGSVLAIGTRLGNSDVRIFEWNGKEWIIVLPKLPGANLARVDLSENGKKLVFGLPNSDEKANNL